MDARFYHIEPNTLNQPCMYRRRNYIIIMGLGTHITLCVTTLIGHVTIKHMPIS